MDSEVIFIFIFIFSSRVKQKRPWDPKVEMRVLKCFATQLMTVLNLITTMNRALM